MQNMPIINFQLHFNKLSSKFLKFLKLNKIKLQKISNPSVIPSTNSLQKTINLNVDLDKPAINVNYIYVSNFYKFKAGPE